MDEKENRSQKTGEKVNETEKTDNLTKNGNEELLYKNWLYHVPGIGRIRFRKLIEHYGSAKNVWGLCREPFCKEPKTCGFTEADLNRVRNFREKVSPGKLWEELERKKIRVMSPEDQDYPGLLRQIPDRPELLYLKTGEMICMADESSAGLFSRPSIAVIGSRICSEYGRMIATRIGKLCAGLGMGLVSGMAVGIDGIAQRAAVQAGGFSMAVLGSGVDVCYPSENESLYEGLLENGCIISEYIPGTVPKPGNFPPRNRIISGLVNAVIVVEAKEKSGTMITVDMALEQGRQVYIIPGRLTDPLSAGCNRLIAQGAQIIWNLSEVLENICREETDRISASGQGKAGLTQKTGPELVSKIGPAGLKDRSLQIWKELDIEGLSLQQIYERIMEKTEISFGELQGILLDMELSGYVKTEGSRFFPKL